MLIERCAGLELGFGQAHGVLQDSQRILAQIGDDAKPTAAGNMPSPEATILTVGCTSCRCAERVLVRNTAINRIMSPDA
jgi:hypothetical protein